MSMMSTNTLSREVPGPFAMLLDLSCPLPGSWEPVAPGQNEAESQPQIDQLAKDHMRYLLDRALRLTRNQADAADLVQDTFERALKFAGPRVCGGRARNWLLVVMHNLFVDRYRATRSVRLVHAQDLLLQLPAAEVAETDPRDHVTIDDVQRALTKVPEPLRRVFELREMQGRSYADIAAELHIPLVTVGTRLLRARRHIKATLAQPFEQQQAA